MENTKNPDTFIEPSRGRGTSAIEPSHNGQNRPRNYRRNEKNTASIARSPVGDHVWPQAPGLSLLEQVECSRELARITEDGHQGVVSVQVRSQGGVRASGQLLKERQGDLPLTALWDGWGTSAAGRDDKRERGGGGRLGSNTKQIGNRVSGVGDGTGR